MQITLARQMASIVRNKRLELGITQKALAKQAGVSERSIIYLEQGKATGIRMDKLISILDVLELAIHVEQSTTDQIRKERAKALRACDSSLSTPRIEDAFVKIGE